MGGRCIRGRLLQVGSGMCDWGGEVRVVRVNGLGRRLDCGNGTGMVTICYLFHVTLRKPASACLACFGGSGKHLRSILPHRMLCRPGNLPAPAPTHAAGIYANPAARAVHVALQDLSRDRQLRRLHLGSQRGPQPLLPQAWFWLDPPAQPWLHLRRSGGGPAARWGRWCQQHGGWGRPCRHQHQRRPRAGSGRYGRTLKSCCMGKQQLKALAALCGSRSASGALAAAIQ